MPPMTPRSTTQRAAASLRTGRDPRRVALLAIAGLLALAGGCGYHLSGHSNALPGVEGAQAVLKGTILSYTLNPVAISELGRATRYEILITAYVFNGTVTTE